MILSLLSVALIFFVLGAPFLAALEIIVYAGAIMVLFVFVVMLLNLREVSDSSARLWAQPRSMWGPGLLAAILLAELVYVMVTVDTTTGAGLALDPEAISLSLFGPYLLGVELASILLLAGLVGAYHLGRRYGQPGREGR
jgi:NADH-quinone oxidoreductase subunit J